MVIERERLALSLHMSRFFDFDFVNFLAKCLKRDNGHYQSLFSQCRTPFERERIVLSERLFWSFVILNFVNF